MPVAFRLRFGLDEIDHWADRYEYPGEQELIATVPPRVRAAGFLTGDDLLEIGVWKSPRVRSRIRSNAESLVQEASRIALSTREEHLRLHVLLALYGVGWPVASVVLHLCHEDPYPILDFRALWSATVDVPSVYSFPFWRDYTNFCRETAEEAGVSMRQLDRAMWQYSKEQQGA
jgi:hypothetical protein